MKEIIYTVKCLLQPCYKYIKSQNTDDIKRITSEIQNFQKKVKEILNCKKGWSRCNVEFIEVPEITNKEKGQTVLFKQNFGNVQGVRDAPTKYVEILLCPSDIISDHFCPVLEGNKDLSCADLRKIMVYVNLQRWLFGSDFKDIPLDDYQIYLINHEIGHAVFGLLHPECENLIGYKKSPVMLQQTINLCDGNLKFNPYPLYEEIKPFKK